MFDYRKYYIPGIISLTCLPIVFISFIVSKMNEPRQFLLETNMPSLKDSNIIKDYFISRLVDTIKEYTITNDKNANESVLRNVLIELDSLSKNIKDKVSIRIKIPDETSMQEYVNLRDWIYKVEIKRYAFKNNYLYISPISVYENKYSGLSNCVIHDDNYFENSNRNKFKVLFEEYWHHGKELLILYFLFLFSIIIINIKYLR